MTRPHVRRHVGAAAPGSTASTAQIYLYHIVDNAWSMREFGHQAVVWQTAVMPAVAIELLATGTVEWRRRARARGAAVPSRSSSCSTSTASSGSGTTGRRLSRLAASA